MSANLPCNGGIIAPPRIIIIKKEDPCEVYLPNPLILKSKIQGHIIEQNNPPLINENNATYPLENNPVNIAIIPNNPNILRVDVGLSFAKKNPAICIVTKIAYHNRWDISKPEEKFRNKTNPNAM